MREPPCRQIARDSLQLRHQRQPLGQLADCLQHRNGSGPGDRWRVGLMCNSELQQLQQLQWRADDRWLEPERASNGLDLRAERRVGDMGAGPCKQLVHAALRRNGDVERVEARLGWKRCAGQEGAGNGLHLPTDLDQRQSGGGRQPAGRRLGRPYRSLFDRELRDEHLEAVASMPPCSGRLLVAGDDDVPAATGRQVADHRGFQIDLRPCGHDVVLSGHASPDRMCACAGLSRPS